MKLTKQNAIDRKPRTNKKRENCYCRRVHDCMCTKRISTIVHTTSSAHIGAWQRRAERTNENKRTHTFRLRLQRFRQNAGAVYNSNWTNGTLLCGNKTQATRWANNENQYTEAERTARGETVHVNQAITHTHKTPKKHKNTKLAIVIGLTPARLKWNGSTRTHADEKAQRKNYHIVRRKWKNRSLQILSNIWLGATASGCTIRSRRCSRSSLDFVFGRYRNHMAIALDTIFHSDEFYSCSWH